MTIKDPQQQMIQEAMTAIAERRPGRTKLVYDKTKRTIVAVSAHVQTPAALNITAEDADMFGVVTLSSQSLQAQWPRLEREGIISLRLSVWDDGDAFTQHDLGAQPAPTSVRGILLMDHCTATTNDAALRIVLKKIDSPPQGDLSIFAAPDGLTYHAQAWRQADGSEEVMTAIFVNVQPELATRRLGLLETSILLDMSVLCVGLGTGGAHAAIELAKCGVGHFALVDPDRLTVGNVVRHPGGVSHVGRFKVNVVRDLVLEKNPDAQVSVYPVGVTVENLGDITQLIKQADVVVCGTDSRPSKLLINRLCIESDVVAVYGGAFRRAYGGQVLRVRPRESPCYQCFISAMPEQAADVEVSSAAGAAAVAYSDRPVDVEPGLSLDVLPIATFLTKLSLLELLADKPTSLSILKRDFSAPWYLWLNRPEPGTPYASWPPMSESSDEMTINRWYGIGFDRDPGCAACANFIAMTANTYGLDVNSLTELPSPPTKP